MIYYQTISQLKNKIKLMKESLFLTNYRRPPPPRLPPPTTEPPTRLAPPIDEPPPTELREGVLLNAGVELRVVEREEELLYVRESEELFRWLLFVRTEDEVTELFRVAVLRCAALVRRLFERSDCCCTRLVVALVRPARELA